VLPVETDAIDWRQHFPAESFASDTEWATHVAIGWGDQGFFLQTRRWADLRASVAAKALLWPSDACMHVTYKNPKFLGDDARAVIISTAEYQRLVDFIVATFKHTADGAVIPVGEKGYGSYDAFFAAHGTYHCVNTCNSWVGNAMQTAGIRTAWLTPLPKTVFLYLPE
ncbi:MAG: TIGR02117 family protein, partial [Planctomycetota bacterium]